MDYILSPWPWYVAGPLIAFSMYLMFYFGRKFGVSSNLETVCSMVGAGRLVDYFKFDWKENRWNLTFVLGLIIGGFVANQWLSPEQAVAINPEAVKDLADLGIANAGSSYLPPEIFSLEAMFSLKGFLILISAGLLVGFGARYAGGCTSGHGIVGLSNLSIESYIAIAGFFIGGLIMTWFILPYIL